MDSASQSSSASSEAESPSTQSLIAKQRTRAVEEDKAVDAVIAAHPGDERAQIDAIAEIRRYFRGDVDGVPTRVVLAYMAGDTTLEEAVRQLAEPIERTYRTGDGGRLLVSEEETARHQRTFHSPEAALEMWGPEEDLDALRAAVTDADDTPTTEGQLWDLYYSILHTAKMTPWRERDGAAQQRLVDLVAALKLRPDPPPPANMTVAASQNWVWEGGLGLWSYQILFGASARETWNDSPGCGAGWHPPEVQAWTNVNAFVARLTVRGIRDFRLYGMWAVREALEDDIVIGNHHPADSVDQMADSLFAVAAVWVQVAGQYIYERLKKDGEAADGEAANENDITVAQWKRWRQRFAEEAEKGRYTPRVTELAGECAELMVKIEEGQDGGEGENKS